MFSILYSILSCKLSKIRIDVLYIMLFQMRYVCKNPPGGGTKPLSAHRLHRIKRVVPCRCMTGTLKNPAKCLWRWEPDRRYSFFFKPPAHLCRHIYDWNIVHCDVQQPIQLNYTKLSRQNWQNTCRKYDVLCRNSPVTQTGFICPITEVNSAHLFTFGKNYSRQLKTCPVYANHC